MIIPYPEIRENPNDRHHVQRKIIEAIVKLFNASVKGIKTAAWVTKELTKLITRLLKWSMKITFKSAKVAYENGAHKFVAAAAAVSAVVYAMIWIHEKVNNIIDSVTEGFYADVPKAHIISTAQQFEQCIAFMNESIVRDLQNGRGIIYVAAFANLFQYMDANTRENIYRQIYMRMQVEGAMKRFFVIENGSQPSKELVLKMKVDEKEQQDEATQAFASAMAEIICHKGPQQDYMIVTNETPPEWATPWAFKLGQTAKNVKNTVEAVNEGIHTVGEGIDKVTNMDLKYSIAFLAALGVVYTAFKVGRKFIPRGGLVDAIAGAVRNMQKKEDSDEDDSDQEDSDIESDDAIETQEEFDERIKLEVHLYQLSQKGRDIVAVKEEIRDFIKSEYKTFLDKQKKENEKKNEPLL